MTFARRTRGPFVVCLGVSAGNSGVDSWAVIRGLLCLRVWVDCIQREARGGGHPQCGRHGWGEAVVSCVRRE